LVVGAGGRDVLHTWQHSVNEHGSACARLLRRFLLHRHHLVAFFVQVKLGVAAEAVRSAIVRWRVQLLTRRKVLIATVSRHWGLAHFVRAVSAVPGLVRCAQLNHVLSLVRRCEESTEALAILQHRFYFAT